MVTASRRGRKGPVMKRRRFTQDFKRSVVEQLPSETAGPAELCREADLEARARELEGLRGKVTLENKFLKKAVCKDLKRLEKKQSSLP